MVSSRLKQHSNEIRRESLSGGVIHWNALSVEIEASETPRAVAVAARQIRRRDRADRSELLDRRVGTLFLL